MKNLKGKKNPKGMTLIEIIISIAIVAVMTTVLVATSASINKYIRSANKMNERVAKQAPIAEAKDISKGELMTVNAAGDPAVVNIILTPAEGQIDLSGRVYQAYPDDAQYMQDNINEAGGYLNMKYIDNIETTETTT